MRFSCLIFALFSTVSLASVQPSSLVEYVNGEQKFILSEVFNSGDKMAFIKVEAEEVMDYQGENNDRRDIDMVNGDHIAFTPTKLIVTPDMTATTKIFFRSGREQDRLYRVRYMPVRGEERARLFDQEQDESSAAVGMDIVYSQGILVAKQSPSYNTQLNSIGTIAKARNQGDSYVRLVDMVKCNQKNKCIALGDVTVFAQSTKEIAELSKQEYIRGYLVEGNNKQPFTLTES